MFRSMPTKFTSSGRPISRANVPSAICLAVFLKFSGSLPQSWATNEVSDGTNCNFLINLLRPGLCSPSTFTNSVTYKSAGAVSATTCLKTVSVTSSIGANTKNGLGSLLILAFSFFVILFVL